MTLLSRTACALIAGTLFLSSSALAGVVRLVATINAAQVTAGSTSTATGSAVMIYDVTANKFDLAVTINGLSGPLTASQIREAMIGVAGNSFLNFGGQSSYTVNGATLTANFTDITYPGTVANLICGCSYLNYQTAGFPNGEIRGQLVPDPVKLTAIINAAQQTTGSVSTAYGAAQFTYKPDTSQITSLVYIYNFANTITASRIHEGAVGVAGPIRRELGSTYINNGTSYVQLFSDQGYSGSAALLLSERAYINITSNVHDSGEIRGQLFVENPTDAGRLVNVSARAQVGTGGNVLITGLYVDGDGPARVLVTGRGPSFAGILAGTLANPIINLYDTAGRLIFTNDNVGTAPFQPLITAFTSVSFTSAEAGALLVLPPGGYTILVSGAGATTGVGIGEAFEVSW